MDTSSRIRCTPCGVGKGTHERLCDQTTVDVGFLASQPGFRHVLSNDSPHAVEVSLRDHVHKVDQRFRFANLEACLQFAKFYTNGYYYGARALLAPLLHPSISGVAAQKRSKTIQLDARELVRWAHERNDILYRAQLNKFFRHPGAGRILLATGTAHLIGHGGETQWSLMAVRAQLQSKAIK